MSRAENISALVCLDLDGTFLNRAGQVSERNRAALISCLDKGAAVCFVTGRPYCFAKSLAVSIDPRIGVVAGAGACYEWEGELIEHPLPEDARRKFVDCLARSSAHAFFKGRRLFYTHDVYDRRFLYDWMNDRFPEEYRVQSLTELTFEELKERTEKIHKILVYEEDREGLDAFETLVSGIPGIQASRYNDVSFDVTSACTDKGRAIRDIRSRMGIPRERVLAVGDAPNDLPMFREAGVCVAMGNAKEEIKKACKKIAGSNEEDGAAQVLEHLESYLDG